MWGTCYYGCVHFIWLLLDCFTWKTRTIFYIYIYAFSRCFYPKYFIQVIYLLLVCVFPGIETMTFCAANAMLYHWATGTQYNWIHVKEDIHLPWGRGKHGLIFLGELTFNTFKIAETNCCMCFVDAVCTSVVMICMIISCFCVSDVHSNYFFSLFFVGMNFERMIWQYSSHYMHAHTHTYTHTHKWTSRRRACINALYPYLWQSGGRERGMYWSDSFI